jgi:hypothetical protein
MLNYQLLSHKIYQRKVAKKQKKEKR